ncbi:hypothetical protein MBCUT_00440 [Methanobrevibacter cuticularis]|uniref:KTSC domain-containing protein n=1 Tax=Methanobrevibacter cuticularis TaxID=47311 RepID=A0A166FJU6_9EURY|nr:KTSC domain-containing protein [Methanobrevibacter cuticularis]KZX17749.1 hypothetical protein MBCUT_00440 [Methanobrevibacter cuticularis]
MVIVKNSMFYSINYNSEFQELIIIYSNMIKDTYIDVPKTLYLEFESSRWTYSFFRRKIKGKFVVYKNDTINFNDEFPDDAL